MNHSTPIYRLIAHLTRRFHQDESGATLTEFVITLPIWIVMFMGIITMGQLGIGSTANQLTTQIDLWDKVVDASTGHNEDHMFPMAAGTTAAGKSMDVSSRSGNPHSAVDVVNAGVMLESGISRGLASGGTLGESHARTLPLSFAPGNSVPDDFSSDPDDILKVGSDYPRKVVHDGVVHSSWKNGGGDSIFSTVSSYLGSALSASGAVAALAAGARYGEVYAQTENTEIPVLFGQSITANSHANLLVAPSPLTGSEAENIPFIVARLLAEGEENYSVMMNFGDSEWEDTGNTREYEVIDEDEIRNEAEDLADEAEECNGEDPPSSCEQFCDDNPDLCD